MNEPRFLPEQLNELARVIDRDYSNMSNVYLALRQAASDAAEIDRLRGVITEAADLIDSGFPLASHDLRAALAEGNGQEGGV